MLTSLLMKWKQVRLAETAAEREAIYRFRYRVYVEELNREIGGIDHHHTMVRDAEDEKPYSYHLYVGSPSAIEGVGRVRVWEPGAMPEDIADKLSLQRFGEAASWLRTSELGRLMIDPARRGGLVLPSMARAGYEFLARDKRVDISFFNCRPGLVSYYRRLGARPYGGALVDEPEGMEVPLVSVLSDYSYYKAVKSPLAPWVRKNFGHGKRPPVDTSSFAHLFEDDAQNIVTDRGAVWAELSEALRERGDGELFFLDGLPQATLQRLVSNGFILEVPEGKLVTREDHVERELYIVLSGALEVFRDSGPVAKLGRGDVFGEVAFFRDTGRRSASVRALRHSRIVTLRRKFLDDLGKVDPPGAQALLFNLAKVLAERLAARP
jgi:hypothetical protein